MTNNAMENKENKTMTPPPGVTQMMNQIIAYIRIITNQNPVVQNGAKNIVITLMDVLVKVNVELWLQKCLTACYLALNQCRNLA